MINRFQLTVLTLMVMTLLIATVGVAVVSGQSGIDEWGLSDKEREDLHLRLRAEDIGAQRAFLDEFVKQGSDPSKLETHPYQAERSEPRPSLSVAADQASLIVHGVVESQRYKIDDTGAIYTVSTIAVKETLKGPSSPLVEITQPGGPRLDGDHAHLIISDANPPIFPGDEVVLFALTQRLGTFLQAYTGQYRLVDGRIVAHPANPFRNSVSGQDIGAFRESIASLTSE